MTDKYFSSDIIRLKKALIKRLEWGPAEEWHSSMFTELSKSIFARVGVMISAITLKRFFGVIKHEGVPSITTLDVLSKFMEYENWRTFRLNKRRNILPSVRGVTSRSAYVLFGFALAIVTVLLIANQRPEIPEWPEGITFSSRALTKSYPNSVVFDLDLKQVKADRIQIQQYWDTRKTIDIAVDQRQATGIYYFPGYFRAKLMIDGISIKEHDLFLKSNGWIGTIEYEPVPKYFTPKTTGDNGLNYPSELLAEIIESETPLVSVYHYIDDMGNVSGDNFHLEASIKNSYDDKWAVCQAAQIYIIGSSGAMIFPFSKVGCSSENNLMLNDVYLDGKEVDLSAFGVDLDNYTSIKIDVKEQDVSIAIRDQKIYQGTYSSSMGRLVGLRFKFLGLGEVEFFQLKDQHQRALTFE